MDTFEVLDNKGGTCLLMFLNKWDQRAFIDRQWAGKWAIRLPDGDWYTTWLPVFTEWWD